MSKNKKICTVIAEKNFEAVMATVKKFESDSDLFELRADYLENLSEDLISKLRTLFKIPVIFTLRSQDQGGKTTLTNQERLVLFQQAIDCSYDFIDLEVKSGIEKDLIKGLSRYIFSYHNFERTPDISFLEELKRTTPVEENDLLKIAVQVNSNEDIKVLTEFLIADQSSNKLIVVGMGDLGKITRVAFPFLGSFLTYVSSDNKIAAGQISLSKTREIFSILEG